MPQDPQTSIFSIQRKSNEGLLVVSEYVTVPLEERTLQTPYRDDFKDFIRVKAYASDKGVLSGKRMGVQDYALYSTFTEEKNSIADKSFGNEQMIPVMGFLKDEEVGVGGEVIRAGYYEGVIDATLTHDKTTELYHLWYYVNGWTPSVGTNNFNKDKTMFPLASQQYDSTLAAAFSTTNWFVVPQRNKKVSELKNAARVLLHTVGKKIHLAEGGENAGNWLVTRMPEVVAYWPFGATAMGGMALSTEERIAVDYQPRNYRDHQQFKPTHHGNQPISGSPCRKFNGTINFLCDIEFFLTPCCIAKYPGKLIVQNGEICEGSGCSCSSVSSGDCP